jgi:hypothetical protein
MKKPSPVFYSYPVNATSDGWLLGQQVYGKKLPADKTGFLIFYFKVFIKLRAPPALNHLICWSL